MRSFSALRSAGMQPTLDVMRPQAAVLFAVSSSLVLIAAVASAGRPPARELRLATRRVQATPVPTPAPTPRPVPREQFAFPDYPPLDNPGGGIVWIPSRDAGPFATDGTVSMPAIGVRASIVRVGVNQRSEMVTPRNARDVAWLDQGPFPGATNNGVLAGHRNWSGRAGSFEKLERLRDGDPVVVRFGAQSWTFRVIWVRLYDPRNAPVDQLMGYTEHPSVTLITCGGTFNRRTRHYESRWIARAELVEA